MPPRRTSLATRASLAASLVAALSIAAPAAALDPGDTLILAPRLGPRPSTDRVGSSPASAARGTAASPAGASVTGNTCTGWNYQGVPPQTIWVWRHLTGVSEQYDFLFYV